MADDWKYAVEDFDDTDENSEAADAAENTTDGRATDVFGEAGVGNIEPGSPTFENALFVALGVALALVVILGV